LLWHTDISCVKDLLTRESLITFVSGFTDLTHAKTHLSGYELGVFFSIFVMFQFWNLFNAKYYRTDRSLLMDIIDLFRNPLKVRESFSAGFIWISLVIVVGQILIVTFAGRMFNVSPLYAQDWLWIMIITSPVLIIADLVRTIVNLIKK
jgi:Ca2+-transporting ATPase